MFVFTKTMEIKAGSVKDPYTGKSLIEPYNSMTNSNQIAVVKNIYQPLDSPAKKAGLKNNDEIIRIDNEAVSNFQMILEKISTSGDKKEKIITVKRGSRIIDFRIKPIINPDTGQSRIGIIPNPDWAYHASTKIAGFPDDSPAQKAGLKTGDRIIQINNKKINSCFDIVKYISARPGELLSISIERDNKKLSFPVKTINIKGKGRIQASFKNMIYISKSKNILFAVFDGFKEANDTIKKIIYGLKLMVTGKINMKKAIAGPVKIVNIIGEVTKTGGILMFFYITAFISIYLGFFNLLPIPALDGSYIIIFLFEMIFRTKLNYKYILVIQNIFLFIIIGLMLWVTSNDII